MTQTMPPIKKISIKTLIIFIAIWFVAIIAIFAGSAIYNKHQGKKYLDSAVPYLQKTIPILSQWDPEQIKGLMTPETLDKIPEDKLLTLINWFSRLGELQKVEEPKFKKKDARTLGTSEQQTIVEYSVPLQYENGEATLNIKLLDRADTFTIYHFSFSSERLTVK